MRIDSFHPDRFEFLSGQHTSVIPGWELILLRHGRQHNLLFYWDYDSAARSWNLWWEQRPSNQRPNGCWLWTSVTGGGKGWQV